MLREVVKFIGLLSSSQFIGDCNSEEIIEIGPYLAQFFCGLKCRYGTRQYINFNQH